MDQTTVTEALVVTIVPKLTNVKLKRENRMAKIPKGNHIRQEMMLTSSKSQEIEPCKD
jgi:hypothetical protein